MLKKPLQSSLFKAPEPRQEYCSVCGVIAHWALNDNGERTWWCRTHVPEEFVSKSIVALLEETFIGGLENNSTGSAGNAPVEG